MSTAVGAVGSRIALYEARATFQRKEAEGILQPGAAQKIYSELLQDVCSRYEQGLIEAAGEGSGVWVEKLNLTLQVRYSAE